MRIHLQTLLRRYWLVSTILLFALLMSYTSLPVAGAAPTPTPDVETVPPLEELLTPTNTPFPTPTAAVNPAPESAVPTATKRPPTTTDDNNAPGGGTSAGTGQTPSQPTEQQPVGNAPAVTTNNQTTIFSGAVAVTLLELRKTPATDGRIVDTAFSNDRITILGRTPDGTWWLICCGTNKRQGWALPEVIRPNFTMTSANSLIPIVLGSTAGVTLTTAITTSKGATNTKGAVLQLEMRPKPAFVWQGQQFELQLIITNVGDTAASNVRLRNDLPTALRYSTARINQSGMIRQQTSAQGNTIFTIDWKRLAPGEKATASIMLQVAADAPAGALIDNLALVSAENAADVVAGITLAMPPTLAPQFR